MKRDDSLMNLCFEITDRYERYFKDRLLENSLSSEDAEEIAENFDFRKELVFSVNKEYRKGSRFADFCSENGISCALPSMLHFDGQLYHHQEEAVRSIMDGTCTVISTGTGSGKTESFLIPVLDYCLKKNGKGIKAIIVYPMNALASDQLRRIAEAVEGTALTFGIFTGSTPKRGKTMEQDYVLSTNQLIYREDIIEGKPDILVTNYVMLDYILTDTSKRRMLEESGSTLKYVVVDEVHTYRGNKGTHLKYLLLRLDEYFANEAVKIGCSATLNRNLSGERQEGYLGSGAIDVYIKRMFSVDRYSYIEPVYEVHEEYEEEIRDPDYRELKSSPITKILRDYLNGGSRTLTEILRMLERSGSALSEADFREYLKLVVDMNNRISGHPLLDFRVHVFLLDISNVLKRCMKCGRYQTGTTEICSSCGHPVFPVYRGDFTKCVGKVSGKTLCNDLDVYPHEKGSAFHVLIETEKLGSESRLSNLESLSFKTSGQVNEEGISLEHDRDGKLRLYYLPGSQEPGEVTIKLGSQHKKEFLYGVFKQSLGSVCGEGRKILAFIDNRERAGRYSAIFNDEFMSEFFTECVKLVNGQSSGLSIEDVLKETTEELKNTLFDMDDQVLAEDVLKEFRIWFTRSISIPGDSRLEETLPLRLVNNEALENEGEKEFTEILLKEKIIDREPSRDNGKHIRFYCGHSKFRKVAVLESGLESPGGYSILSFGSSGQKYRAFAESHKSRLRSYAGAHSSEVPETEKRRHEADFQGGKLNLLVSTPTLEMGIDIGKLGMVYMIGVPPMPSNYAQRAGRAGRRGNRFALLVTMCSEGNNHDMYYFNNPKEMIEGSISPPSFDDSNMGVIKKHMSALLIPDLEKGMDGASRCSAVLGGDMDYRCCLEEMSRMWRAKGALQMQQKQLYDMGIYPDYSFRKDQVNAVGDKDALLSSRDPEQAYREFVPGKSQFLGEEYYRFTSEGKYRSFESANAGIFREYSEMRCDGDIREIYKDTENGGYDTAIKIAPRMNRVHQNQDRNEIVTVFFEKELPIFFMNNGIRAKEGPLPFSDSNGEFRLGYSLQRDSLLFEFKGDVVNKETAVSLCAALDRTFKDTLGFDESEVGWIMAEPIEFEEKEKQRHYCLMYDKTGCGNLNVERIFRELNCLLETAWHRLSSCSCESTGGCYLCMKGYSVQWYSHLMNKRTAVMISGYLIGKNRYVPSIVRENETIGHDLDLELNFQGNSLKILAGGKALCSRDYTDMNAAVFGELAGVLKAFTAEGDAESVLIEAKQEYIVNAINAECRLKSGKEEFKLFKFYCLGYEKVEGVKR